MQAKYDDMEVDEDIELPPPRQPARARSLAPPAAAPAAPEPEPVPAPAEEEEDANSDGEDADSEAEVDDAPAKPSANPFARSTGPAKSVLEAGAKSALKGSTPSTANKNGPKRKATSAPLGKKAIKAK